MLGPANPDGTKRRSSTWTRELTPGECDEKWAEMETGKAPSSWTEAWEAAGLTSEALCHSGCFPFRIHSPPSAPGRGYLLVLLPPCSRRFLRLIYRLLFITSNVTVSQVPVPGPLLFPTCPPQWWFIQCHGCRSPLSSFDPTSKLQSPWSSCLFENPTGQLVGKSAHHAEPLAFCPLQLVSPSSPHPRQHNSSLLVVQGLKTYKAFLSSLFFSSPRSNQLAKIVDSTFKTLHM